MCLEKYSLQMTDGYIMDNFRKVVGRNDAANTEFSALKNGRVRQAKDKIQDRIADFFFIVNK